MLKGQAVDCMDTDLNELEQKSRPAQFVVSSLGVQQYAEDVITSFLQA